MGVVAAGQVPNTSDGMVAVLTDTTRALDRFNGDASLSVTGTTKTSACVQDSSGKTTGLDLVSGKATAQSKEECNANGELLVSSSQSQSSVISDSTHMKLAAAGQPAASYSFYVSSSFVDSCTGDATTSCPLWQMGADTSVPVGGALNIIDFGAPCRDPSSGLAGVQTFFRAVCYPDSTVLFLTEKWVNGYQATHGGSTPPSIIAAGVSNSVNGIPGDPITAIPNNDPATINEMAYLGVAFGQIVVGPLQGYVNGGAAPLTAWGAIDAEEASGSSWLGPQPTRAFVDNFGAATNHNGGTANHCVGSVSSGMLADFGDAVYMEPNVDPQRPSSSWGPSGGWTADDIYHVAYGDNQSAQCAVPEIYFNSPSDPVNAWEWVALSHWATEHGHAPITFTAAMSENGVDGTESAADSIASLDSTSGQNVPYVTIIAWHIVTSPATLNALPGSEATSSFPVTWQTASGITDATYRLYSQDITTGATWAVWADNTTSSSATFFGVPNHSYNFFIETYGGGYDNGGPGSAEASTSIASSATSTLPYPLYAVDGYGFVRPASSPPQVISGQWIGWNIARGIAVLPDGSGGYVLDGYGGIHPFGSAPPVVGGPYWGGWDIARGIALTPSGHGGYVLDGYGGVHPFAVQGYSLPPQPANGPYWGGWDIARAIVLSSDQGGYVLDGFGGLHPFGDAQALAGGPYWGGWDIARSVVLNPSHLGGYILDGYGGIHSIGSTLGASSTAYWGGWDIARSIVLVPGSGSAGWTVDGLGGFHSFGGAPGVTDNFYGSADLVRGAAS